MPLKIKNTRHQSRFCSAIRLFFATQRFFPINKFPKEAVKHVTKMLGFKLSETNLKNYTDRMVFVQHQYYRQQDALIAIFIKCVQAARNAANKEKQKPLLPKQKTLINLLRETRKDDKALISEIKTIMQTAVITS
jgi:hypothetical protein